MEIEVVINKTIEEEIVVTAEDFFHIPYWAIPDDHYCAKCENSLEDRLCLVIKTSEGIVYMHRHCFHSYFGIKAEALVKTKKTISRKK